MNVSVTCYSYVLTKWNLLKHLFPTPEKKIHWTTLAFLYVPTYRKLLNHVFSAFRNKFICLHMHFLPPEKFKFIETYVSYVPKKFH